MPQIPEEATRVILAWLRVYVAAFLTYVLTALAQGTVLDPRAALTAGLVSTLPIIINWLNPGDTRYGRGYEAGE